MTRSYRATPPESNALSNLYWARNTNVDAIEHVCVEAWARLFRVPYLRAVNR